MIMHIVPDEKFIDMAYNIFEKANPNNNKFVTITTNKTLKYIKTTPVQKVSHNIFFSKEFIQNLDKYEFIVLHWLDFHKMILIKFSNPKIKFLWIGWGGDYYEDYISKNRNDMLLEKTLEISYTKKYHLKKVLKNTLLILLNRKKIINRINYFAPVLQEDYYLVKNSFQEFKPKYLDWNYGTLEDDLIRNMKDFEIIGNNILVGNSATDTNNHIEAFEVLSQLFIKNRKIIVPLSYGDIKYRNKVISYGNNLFTNFTPLTEFMDIDEYNTTISTCSIVIMNHLRQQALGNIISMMYFGAKIFLNKKNPIYEFFKKNGAFIFSMEELTNENINIKLTEEEKNKNKIILKEYWSRDVVIWKTKKIIETIKSNN